MGKQQGPPVQHREIYSIFYDKPYGKEYKKEHIYIDIYIHTHTYICKTESLCCTIEIDTL